LANLSLDWTWYDNGQSAAAVLASSALLPVTESRANDGFISVPPDIINSTVGSPFKEYKARPKATDLDESINTSGAVRVLTGDADALFKGRRPSGGWDEDPDSDSTWRSSGAEKIICNVQRNLKLLLLGPCLPLVALNNQALYGGNALFCHC